MNRPRQLKSETPYIQTPEGKIYVHLGENTAGELIEIMPTIGKSGDIKAEIAKIISLLGTELLQRGMPAADLAKLLRRIQSGNPIWDEGMLVMSISDGVAIIIEEYLNRKINDTSGNPPAEV